MALRVAVVSVVALLLVAPAQAGFSDGGGGDRPMLSERDEGIASVTSASSPSSRSESVTPLSMGDPGGGWDGSCNDPGDVGLAKIVYWDIWGWVWIRCNYVPWQGYRWDWAGWA